MPEEELIEHTIEIDEYISASIKIPKVMKAIDFKAIMYKANKLFNLADVTIRDSKAGRQTRTSLEDKQKLVSEWKNGDKSARVAMAERLGKTYDNLSKKIAYLKRRYNIL